MNFQVLQPGGAAFYLIPDGEFFLRLKLTEYIAPCGNGAETLLVPGDYVLGNIPVHGRLIAFLKASGPIDACLFTAAVGLTFACVKIYLINAKVVHAEGVEYIVAALLKHPE